MINPSEFYKVLRENDFSFFSGVPDSLLKELCLAIKDNTDDSNNIIAANEGTALGILSGYNIATSKYGVLYMQNSGLGNIINPLLSLADEEVYKIPMLLIIGYRGEPNTKDEPQHIKQGKLTLPLLDTLGIKYFILDKDYENQVKECKRYLDDTKKVVALVVKKGTFFDYDKKIEKDKTPNLTREDALDIIINKLNDDDFIVSTTGKASREIFELREKYEMSHANDFLTVGSMGHASSLALGISLKTKHNVFCIDGDGAFIMHMGGLAVAIQNAKENFKYILINNHCHESVGAQPTIANDINIEGILKSFGFKSVLIANTKEEVAAAILELKNRSYGALIINTNQLSRKDLGRPTTTPIENKQQFERKLRKSL